MNFTLQRAFSEDFGWIKTNQELYGYRKRRTENLVVNPQINWATLKSHCLIERYSYMRISLPWHNFRIFLLNLSWKGQSTENATADIINHLLWSKSYKIDILNPPQTIVCVPRSLNTLSDASTTVKEISHTKDSQMFQVFNSNIG